MKVDADNLLPPITDLTTESNVSYEVTEQNEENEQAPTPFDHVQPSTSASAIIAKSQSTVSIDKFSKDKSQILTNVNSWLKKNACSIYEQVNFHLIKYVYFLYSKAILVCFSFEC